MENPSSAPAAITRGRALTVAGGVLAGAALAQATFPAFAASAGSVDADAIVVGHGLAGLVATAEPEAAGRKVLLDQEPEASLGGRRSGPSAGSPSSTPTSSG